MRWALVRVSLAVTAMVVIAFAVPLGLVVKELARDRALTNAERQAAAIAPALAITTDRRAIAAGGRHHPGRRARRIALRVPATAVRRRAVRTMRPRAGRCRAPAERLATAHGEAGRPCA